MSLNYGMAPTMWFSMWSCATYRWHLFAKWGGRNLIQRIWGPILHKNIGMKIYLQDLIIMKF